MSSILSSRSSGPNPAVVADAFITFINYNRSVNLSAPEPHHFLQVHSLPPALSASRMLPHRSSQLVLTYYAQ